MTEFLVEFYLSRADAAARGRSVRQARLAAEEQTRQGGDAPGSYRTSVRIAAGQGAEFAVPVIVAVAPSSAMLITRETNRTAGGLTGRELEIMLLVAQGNTSRQIGQALFISPRTARCTSRAACSSWAAAPGPRR